MITPPHPKKEEVKETLQSLIGDADSPAEAEQQAAETAAVNQALKSPADNESEDEQVQNRQDAAMNKGSVTQAK